MNGGMMSKFLKYMHLERFGTDEVDGIEFGTTYVFPKLDGTNAQVWVEGPTNAGGYELKTGSRNRVLSDASDNAGFHSAMTDESNQEGWNIYKLLVSNPNLTLYGEWLVPHSLKTYREDAWRKFYVFDVFNQTTGKFLSYEEYKPLLDHYQIIYLPPIAIIKNGSYEKYEKCLEKNTFAIKDGQGIGEGVVIKNYEFQNRFGRVVWAKIIANHFKEKHHAAMGAPEIGGKILEEQIVEEFVTQHLVDKVHSKIVNQYGGWSSKMINQLLGVVWYDLITEEIWNIIKKHKNPKIDFKTLSRFCVMKVKELKSELF